MKLKLIFKTIYADKDKTDLFYCVSKGIIYNKIKNKIVYQLKYTEIPRYFNFNLEFESYQSNKIYQSNTNTYKNTIIGSIYNLVLYIDIHNLFCDRFRINNKVLKILCYYLIIIQIRQLKTNKSYNITKENLPFKINDIINNPIQLIPWNLFLLGKNITLDLKNIKLVTNKQIPKKKFQKTGCIFESNNIDKLTHELRKKITTKSLVIIPTGFPKLWTNCSSITYTTYIDLVQLNDNFENKFKNKKMIHNIIVHECYIQYIPIIKKLIQYFVDCKSIWIINSLPLKYYISNDNNTEGKFTIGNVFKLANIWANFSTNDKKSYKTEIIRFIMADFNKLYFKINFPTDDLPVQIISPNILELNIFNEFRKFHMDWLSKLNNDKNNIYSSTSKHKNNRIKSKIYDCVMVLSLSVINNNDITIFFKNKIQKTLDINCKISKKIEKMIDVYISARKTSHHKINEKTPVDFTKIVNSLTQKKDKINSVISNYNRYQKNGFYDSIKDNDCPVCYDDDYIKTKLICGHTVCLTCVLNILPNSKGCPLCMEPININKMAIIRESIGESNNYSEMLDLLFKNLSNETLILTNLEETHNIMLYRGFNVWLLKCSFIAKKINFLSKITTVIILSSPLNSINDSDKLDFEMFQEYIKLVNPNISIKRIQLNIY